MFLIFLCDKKNVQILSTGSSFLHIMTTHKKHFDASVKELLQTLIVPSEEMSKIGLWNKHI